MKNAICTICNKPVILIPSASQRAKCFGRKPEYYKNLFPNHSECIIKKRNNDTSKLIKLIY